jgi:hypothetical protein
MMNSLGARNERGQILILVAASMIVLMGVLALAVDLGFSWMLRRQEQNAADPAAIAAARWLRDPVTGDATMNLPAMQDDACFYAQQNGFFEGDVGCANALANKDLQVLSPPTSGDYVGMPGHVQVIIRSSHPTYFGRIFGQTEAQVTTAAVAANTTENSYSSSLHALDPHGCEAGKVQGNGGPSTGAKVTIEPRIDPDTGLPFVGGFVQVNSDCDGPVTPAGLAACGGGTGALKVAGGASLDAPQVYTYGDCARDGGAIITTDDPMNRVNQGTVPVGDPLADLEGPPLNATMTGALCGVGGGQTNVDSSSGCGAGGADWGWVPCADDASVRCVTLSPGVYYGGWKLTTDKYRLLMEPGVYIFAGGGITQNGSVIQAVSGDGDPATAQVLLFNTDNPKYADECHANYDAQPQGYCQSGMNFTSGIRFQAFGIGDFACGIDPTVCPYKGMLLWHDWRGSCPLLQCELSLGSGTQALSIGGTVYAANQLVTLNGSGTVSGDIASIQIISYRWKITGNSEIKMPYDPRDLYSFPKRGLVE